MNNIILINGEEEKENKTEVCSKQDGIYEEFRKLDAKKNLKRPRKQKKTKKITKKADRQREGCEEKGGERARGVGEEEEIKYKLSKSCQKIVKQSKTKNPAPIISGKTHLVKNKKQMKEFSNFTGVLKDFLDEFNLTTSSEGLMLMRFLNLFVYSLKKI